MQPWGMTALLLSHQCYAHQQGLPGLLQQKPTGLWLASWEEDSSCRESPFQDTRYFAIATP